MSRKSRGKNRRKMELPTVRPPEAEQTQAMENGAPASDVILGSVGDGVLSRAQRRAIERGNVTITQQWSGPLPHPAILAQFNEIHPGASQVILDEFQAQGAHRRDIEGRVVRSNVRNAGVAQVLSFVLLAGLVASGAFLAYTGRDVVGFGVIASGVVSGMYGFRESIKAKQQDLANKRTPDKRR